MSGSSRLPSGGDQWPPLDEDEWFAGLSPSLKSGLLRMARPRRTRPGDNIYRVGDPPDGLYAVVSGEIKLIGYPNVGTQLLYAVMRAGSWFGQLSVLDNKPRPHDAIAVGACNLLHVSLADFAAAAEVEPQYYRALALLGCQQQRTMLDYVGVVLTRAPEGRLAAFLLDVSCRQLASGKARNQSVHVTQETLAGVVGVSRQTLNKLVRDLEKSGSIESRYGVITILNRAALIAISCGPDASEMTARRTVIGT